MAKQSGLGDYFAVDDSSGTLREISLDVVSLSSTTTRALQDVTGIDKSGVERLQLLADGTFSVSGAFDGASNMEHDVFANMANPRTATYSIGGNTTGNPSLSMEMLISSYGQTRGADGSLGWTAELSLQSGTVPAWGTVA